MLEVFWLVAILIVSILISGFAYAQARRLHWWIEGLYPGLNAKMRKRCRRGWRG